MDGARTWSRWRWPFAVGLGLMLSASPRHLAAQQPVTLDEALRAVLGSPRAAGAAADSAAAAARLRTAREYPNPALALDYTKSPPTRHVELEQPIEYPWVRSARIGGAQLGAVAAALRAEIERSRIRYHLTAAYVEAASTRAIVALSRQNVVDGDELVRIAVVRRDAGDASDLDVQIAQVNAAQLHSRLITDSIAFLSATLRLQSAMGLPVDSVTVTPADTLIAPAVVPAPQRLGVSASETEARAASRLLSAQLRSRLPSPAVRVGFEQGDPEGDNGILPTLGLSLTLPIWSRNGGAIAEAKAQVQRAAADLALARQEADLAIAEGARARALSIDRLEQDRVAVAAAQQVARGSLTAYSEGAYPLTSVIEEQRSARDALRQYLEDLASAQTADAAFSLASAAGVLP